MALRLNDARHDTDETGGGDQAHTGGGTRKKDGAEEHEAEPGDDQQRSKHGATV